MKINTKSDFKKIKIGDWIADSNGVFEIIDTDFERDLVEAKECYFDDDGNVENYGEKFKMTFSDVKYAELT